MTDLVERQAVLDILKDKWNLYLYADDAIQASIDKIKVMPSVTPTVDVISIPDNATNKDVLMVSFPNCYYIEFIHDVTVYTDKKKQKVIGRFNKEWWNAPYKCGDNNDR